MRRMTADLGRVYKCEHENYERNTIIYIPITDLSDLPVRFDIIIPAQNITAPLTVRYSEMNNEVYGAGHCIGNNGNIIDIFTAVDSLISEEYPQLTLEMSYSRGDLTGNVIADGENIYITNIVHLSKDLNFADYTA